MSRSCIVMVFATACVVAATFGAPSESTAADCGYAPSTQDLFYNFYVGGGPSGAYPAQMYLSPRPTPALVGHTYITYQPFLPHEFMYHHRRSYTRVHHPGGTTRTRIWYR